MKSRERKTNKKWKKRNRIKKKDRSANLKYLTNG